MKNWYIVQTFSGFEQKVAETIKAEAIAEKEVSVEKKETSPEVKDEKSTKEKK